MQQLIEKIPEPLKLVGDIAAVAGWVTALSGVLTALFGLGAAFLSFIWAALRIYESKTVQNWLKKRRGCK